MAESQIEQRLRKMVQYAENTVQRESLKRDELKSELEGQEAVLWAAKNWRDNLKGEVESLLADYEKTFTELAERDGKSVDEMKERLKNHPRYPVK
jgi:hypothetical protein